MTIEAKEEWKQINDWAIAAGKTLHPQTGLIHYCHTALPEGVSDHPRVRKHSFQFSVDAFPYFRCGYGSKRDLGSDASIPSA